MRVSVAHLNDYNFFNNKKERKKVKPKKKAEKKKKKTQKKQKKEKQKKNRKKKKKNKNEGPAHLDLNPPHFSHFSFVVLFPFLSLLPIDQKPCFSPSKGHFMFVFACLPLFSLSLFWPEKQRERKEEKQKKKNKKKHQKPNQRESDKNFWAGQLVVHLSPSVVFFYGGGGPKNR